MKLLVANRGEVAVRVLRSARELGIPTVAVEASDDRDVHGRHADVVVELEQSGPRAYLDVARLVDVAKSTGCTHVHPGWGFLSEDANFARACAEAGIVFVGPPPHVLEVFGDKASARAAAVGSGVPVLDGTSGDASLEEVRALLRDHPQGVFVKAQSAGGGRGLRIVIDPSELDVAYQRCAEEASLASGRRSVFAEEYFPAVRHIEVQVIGVAESTGVTVIALGDRDCSAQRSMQKITEVAPALWLNDSTRMALHESAVRLCATVGLVGVATVEFLVADQRFVFLEVNPRLQVEHTITEAVTGVDLVHLQLDVARGRTLEELDLPAGVVCGSNHVVAGSPASARGVAIQCRLNGETINGRGIVSASVGTVSAFTPPTGKGVRVDTHLRAGTVVTGRYDTLLAKIVVHSPTLDTATAKAVNALDELVLEGLGTNRSLVRAILSDRAFTAGELTTRWVEEHLGDLVPDGDGETVNSAADVVLARGETALRSPMLGTVVAVPAPGDVIEPGADIVVLEAMKMQHAVTADHAVEVVRVLVSLGDTIPAGSAVVTVVASDTAGAASEAIRSQIADVRPDLAEVLERHRLILDDARAERLAKIRGRGRRTVRENIADLVDSGSWNEYAPLVLAAQRRRKSVAELVEETPADGIVAGTASINAEDFGARSDVAVLAYDYSVAAGTQGYLGHLKTDRLLEIANRDRLPVVVFAEGGGGRPNDSDITTTGVTAKTFRAFAELHGKVPMVAVVSGRCFAGNAAVAGACDVLIATPDANIGMGGPAMIEGGGLGQVTPEQIGPIEIQRANGVVHLVANDEGHAVELAKQYLGYFQGRSATWEAPDPRLCRHVVPADRLRAYDVRDAIHALADVDSVLELRRDFGRGIVTALARCEGHPYAVIANDSRHLGGAIDAEAAQKVVAFLRVVRDFELPLLSLADTPGFMVGPDAERDASVTHFSAMFTAGAQLRAPVGAIVLRKGYGLGVMAMFTGHVHVPKFSIAWPTGELGGMGLEGAVRLGARKHLAAIEDPVERERQFQTMVAVAYEMGKAINAATYNEIDDVIDPADSRRWIRQLFRTAPR